MPDFAHNSTQHPRQFTTGQRIGAVRESSTKDEPCTRKNITKKLQMYYYSLFPREQLLCGGGSASNLGLAQGGNLKRF